jgi:ADP-ribose pyrophosphatase
MSADQPPIRIVRTDVIHANSRFKIVRDTQELPDGSFIEWESVVHRDSVLALPVDQDRHAYVVRQFRPQMGRVTLEVIGGGLEDGYSPEEGMHRELREEAGIDARLISLGAADLGTATVRCREHLFLAVVERVGQASPEPFEQLTMVGVERLPLDRVLDLVMDGTISDANSRMTILMAVEHTRRHGLAPA